MDSSSKVNPQDGIQRDAILFPTFLAFVLTIPIFVIAIGLGEGIDGVLAFVFWGLANLALCFFMVRKYPKSAWALWFPCNLLIFIAAVIEPNFWRTDMWKAYAGIVLLSIVGTVLGVVLKKKATAPALDSSVPGDV